MTKNNKVAVALNAVLIVLLACGLYLSYNVDSFLGYFSNDLALISLIASILYIVVLLSKKDASFVSLILRFISSSCLALVFVASFYVASEVGTSYIDGLKYYFIDKGHLFFNLLCPLLSFISFTRFEGDRRLNKKKTIYYALIPTVVYGAIMFVLNMLGKFSGPYAFLSNNNPVYFTIIIAVVFLIVNYIIARFMLLLNQKHAPRRKK